jgi:tetratricopeptide (TPR) repeat protein
MENNQKSVILSLIPAILAGIIFLLAWTEPNVDLMDPWYRALNKMNKALKMKKDDPEKYKKLMDEAGAQFEELVEKHPYHAKLRMLNGYYNMNIGNTEKAISELKVSIDKGKGGIVNQIEYQAGDMLTQVVINETNAMISKAKKENNKDLVIKANKMLEELLPYAPHNPNMHFQYGLTFSELGEPYKALEQYEKAIKINPKHEPAGRGKAALNFILGNKNVSENNFKQAYIHYKIAQSIIPNHPDYNNNLGNVCLKLNKFKEAVSAFQRALKKNPKSNVYKGNLQIAKNALAQQKKANGK